MVVGGVSQPCLIEVVEVVKEEEVLNKILSHMYTRW